MDSPIDHLIACHDRIEERLKTIEKAAGVLASQPEEARAALEGCFRYFETSGVLHTADEEESIFPRLVSRLKTEDRAYLEELERQHRQADELFAALRKVPSNEEELAAYRETVSRFCALYRAHIASENEKLMSAARTALPPEELKEISEEMKRRRGTGSG
jgi:hemerythrin-like domain-containing protein